MKMYCRPLSSVIKTETLIKSLSQLPNLSVKARSSVFRYKGQETDPQTVGKQLNVQAILNGRVVQRADQLVLVDSSASIQDSTACDLIRALPISFAPGCTALI